jgi:iron(III) transport system permease protein
MGIVNATPDSFSGDGRSHDAAALVYSFVRAITSISAVIFLVSAEYNMATTYIVGLVENGEYGVAIAYSSVLVVVMMVVIAGFQLVVGRRRLRRDDRDAPGPEDPGLLERDLR